MNNRGITLHCKHINDPSSSNGHFTGTSHRRIGRATPFSYCRLRVSWGSP